MRQWASLFRAYLAIRASGKFDAAYYLGQLRRVGYRRAIPLVHYLWSGERRGRQPFPGFAPLLYLAKHEELIGTGVSPLQHFLTRESPVLSAPVAVGDASFDEAARCIAAWQPRKRIAIVCHVFYYQLFDEIAAAIRASDADADLIFTVTGKDGFSALAGRIAAIWPEAAVLPFPNHGRDIFPFVMLVNSGKLEAYDAVCKIHTKMSPHRRSGGGDWRRELLVPLLGGDGRVPRIVGRLKNDPDVGLVVADGQVLSGETRWEGTGTRVRELCARIDIDIDQYELRFPAGSMYWAGPRLIHDLGRLGLSVNDFESEAGQADNTTAHAVERVVGFILQARGLRAVEVGEILSP